MLDYQGVIMIAFKPTNIISFSLKPIQISKAGPEFMGSW
jgi:hypothetical protein